MVLVVCSTFLQSTLHVFANFVVVVSVCCMPCAVASVHVVKYVQDCAVCCIVLFAFHAMFVNCHLESRANFTMCLECKAISRGT